METLYKIYKYTVYILIVSLGGYELQIPGVPKKLALFDLI